MVADVLRKAILRGILSAGQQLRQEEIARQLGVSHIPVREALRQLEAEGLAHLRPYRGFEVSELSPAELEELYEIRIPLECKALRLAMPHLMPEELQRAEGILDAIDRESDPSVWSQLNTKFHTALYAPSGRHKLLNLIGTLRTNVDRYLRLYVSVMQRKPHAQREHREILEAVRRGDVARAVAALEEHLDVTCRMLVDYLRRERQAAERKHSDTDR
jgi:DNA-binding GntR family transcriptional regulator